MKELAFRLERDRYGDFSDVAVRYWFCGEKMEDLLGPGLTSVLVTVRPEPFRGSIPITGTVEVGRSRRYIDDLHLRTSDGRLTCASLSVQTGYHLFDDLGLREDNVRRGDTVTAHVAFTDVERGWPA